MGIRLDHMKGTIKQKIGWATDNHSVEREGKREQVKSDIDAEVDDAIGSQTDHADQERVAAAQHQQQARENQEEVAAARHQQQAREIDPTSTTSITFPRPD
jgi:uncharacterized protein YjbJ (UPF0337 family)